MWKTKYDFTSREKLTELVVDAFTKNDVRAAEGILRHDRDGFLFEEVTLKLLDNKDETAWANFVTYAADRVGPLRATQEYVFKQLFLGNAGVRGTADMYDTVLTVAEKKRLKVDFEVDSQLAFFIGWPETDKRAAGIVDVLVKHGASIDKASAIIDDWTVQTRENWDKRIAELQEAVTEATQRKTDSLANLQTSAEAAKKFAARFKPSAG